MDRSQMLETTLARRESWDIVVIGGGATGVGCALDAASRGLSVLLLEQADFGKGTSGRSTKLIHGGVRYLAQGNLSLVREALAERAVLRKIAPAFVKEQAFVIPCYSRFRKLFYYAGLKIYDLLASGKSFSGTVLKTKEATVEAIPGIAKEGLMGSVRYSDGVFDDSRFLAALSATAAEEGAVLLNYAKVEGVKELPESHETVVQFTDLESGESHEVSTLTVISAAGIFTGSLDSGEKRRATPKLAFSQGIHIVLDPDFLGGRDALMIPKTSDGRVLFAIPWHGKLLVGTTDTPVESASLEPVALESEIDFVLETCSDYLSRKPTRKDIRSVFAGIRPLVASAEGAATSKLSREHHIEVVGNVVTVTGGKWTTYRKMAEESVDAAVKSGGLSAGVSRTKELVVEDERAKGVAKLMSGHVHLAKRLSTQFDYTLADAVYAIRSEMARTIDDVLSRRTRILYTDAAEAIRAAPYVADLMASELGWDQERKALELAEFLNLAANYLPDSSE